MTTDSLSKFIYNLRFENLTEQLVRNIKLYTLDFMGVSMLASTFPWSRSVYNMMDEFGGKDLCSIIGYNRKTSPPLAAFVNGSLAHGIDWDDSHVAAIVHPGAVVIPAALAASEFMRSDGKKFITAVVAGYETMIRIGMAVQPSHSKRGFHATSTCGVFGASAASAKLLGLSLERIYDAISISSSYASGLAGFFKWGSDIKRIHAGKSAQAGITSSFLTRAGIKGVREPLEGKSGFCRAYSDDYNLDLVTNDLGSEYLQNYTMIKAHAAAAHIHSAIEATLHLVKNNKIQIENIKKVIVKTPPLASNSNPDPPDMQGAQMSLPFSVALAIYKGIRCPKDIKYLGPNDFRNNVNNESIRSLLKKISLISQDFPSDKSGSQIIPASIEIMLKNEDSVSHEVIYPKGSFKNPFSQEELIEKFKLCTNDLLPQESMNKIIEIVYDLDNIRNLSILSSFCQVKV